MKSNESILVTKDSLGLILSNVKNKIVQKQVIEKKLTPFLFHHVTTKNLIKNFEGMVKEEQKISMIKQNNDQEPNKIKKDNFNPKDIKLSNKKDLLQKYSSIQLKNGKTPRKRYYSALQTTRQTIKDKDFFDKRPSTSTNKRVSYQKQPKLQSHHKSTNTNTYVQTNKFKIQKTFSNQQSTYRSISSRRLSKKQPLLVKLKQKNSQTQDKLHSPIQQKIRQQKIKIQIEKQIQLQGQALKSQRLQKLKQIFHQKFQNSKNTNFDFDGNIIGLINQHQQEFFKDNLQKIDQNFSKNINTLSSKKNNKSLKTQIINQEPLFLIQTSFKIKQNQQNPDKQTTNSNKNDYSFNKSTISIFQSPQLSYRNSLIKNLNSERIIRTTEKNNQINRSSFNNPNFEQRKTSKNYSLLRSSIKNSSFFSGKQQQNQKKNIQQNNSIELVLNQKDFNNNNQRQISTIPYIEIQQGICFKQQTNQKPKKDESLVQYSTISKKMSLNERESNKVLTGNKTFRPYLSFKKNQDKPIQTFNKTFHTLTDKNKSVLSARIKSNLQNLNQYSSKINNSIKIYSARNPLIEDLDDSVEKVQKQQNNFTFVQPIIPNNFFQSQPNKHSYQKNNNLKGLKINKTQNILDLKAKMIMKQKIQRNLFQMQSIK